VDSSSKCENEMPRCYSLFLIWMGLIFSGCLGFQSLRTVDPHVIHHHTWWNYYERGRLYLKEDDPAKAQIDFEKALGRRPGARYPFVQERWRARTYGVHMLDHYFPHRELGVCLFEQGDYVAALKELELSLAQEPSARAKLYLNRVRKHMTSSSLHAPTFELESYGGWTRARRVILRGVAQGAGRISRLLINDEAEFIELAKPQFHFERSLKLVEGRNEISLSAIDLAGGVTTTTMVWQADFKSPRILLTEVISEGSRLTVRGICEDRALREITANDQPLNGPNFEWSQSANQELVLNAIDQAGNEMVCSFTPAELQQMGSSPPEGIALRLVLADADKTITLYNEEYALDMDAESEQLLASVQLNGEELLQKSGRVFRALHRVPLAIGTNTLEVVIRDIGGRCREQTVRVIRREPEYLDHRFRLAAAVPPVHVESEDLGFGPRVDLLFERELTRYPVRFYLLEDETRMEEVLREKQLSASTLSDPRILLRLGRELSSDLLLVNRMIREGKGWTLSSIVSETSNGRELCREDIYFETHADLPRQIGGLVMKLEQHFPLVKARVVSTKSSIQIDAGSQSGVQERMRFLIVKTQGTFEEGEVLKSDERLIELSIFKVAPQIANGTLTARMFVIQSRVRPGDYVFTR